MNKTIKILLISIPVLIISAVIILYFSLNSIIKKSVETMGLKATGVEVRLEEVNISLFSGEGQLKGILIKNPAGFYTESAFKLNDVRVKIDVLSVFSDRIRINEIYIDAPEITYEAGLAGNNIKTILNNVNAYAARAKGTDVKEAETETEQEKKETKIQIDDFVIKNGKINISITALKGKKATVLLPDIHLKNLGKKEGGAPPAEIIKEIFTELNENIVKAVASSMKSITSSVKDAVDSAVDAIKGLFGD